MVGILHVTTNTAELLVAIILKRYRLLLIFVLFIACSLINMNFKNY